MRRLLACLLALTIAHAWWAVDTADAGQPPPGAGYWYAGIGPSGGPWRWRCPYPVEVQVNWQGLSDAQRAWIRESFERATGWSGHSLDLQGRTFDEPNEAEPGRVVVRMRPFDDPPRPDASGYTDLRVIEGHIRGALILFNRDFDFNGRFENTARHEVGHALGLAHYQADDVTMASWAPLDHYDDRTRNGLRAVGC